MVATPNVLVVEDDPLMMRAVERSLQKRGYRAVGVSDPDAARRMLHVIPIDAIVTDLNLWIEDGRYFAQSVAAEFPRPMVVVTGAPDASPVFEGFTGVAPRVLLPKPFSPDQLGAALDRVLDGVPEPEDDHAATSELAMGFARALAMRDVETEAHAERVALWTGRVAQILGMDPQARFWAQTGALLHDVGKIGVPDAILKKPGSLDAAEWEIMRRHSQYGADLIAPVRRLARARDVVLYHHESWDGAGYPTGLAGEAIPLAARIFSPIDAYDAMTSDRPYRGGMSHAAAIERLVAGRGTQFDPAAIDAITSIDADEWVGVRTAVALASVQPTATS